MNLKKWENLFIFILIITVLSINTFSAPTAPPFNMNEQNTNEDNNELNQITTTVKQTASSTNTPINQEPIINNEINNTTKEKTTSNLILIITLINSTLILGIIITLIYLNIKNKTKATNKETENNKNLNYENSKDSIQYTQTFYKLENYMRTNLKTYSYDAIKTGLIKQGFTPEEIDSVYYEITKK